jgi:prepilin-type N-terminal cleavage/methylation domain-containing protein
MADQRGFTLVELLVAMTMSLVLLTAGVWGVTTAFKQTTQSADRVISTSAAEVGIERLVFDLRYAVNGSCGSGPSVTGVEVALPATNVYTISMCESDGTIATSTGLAEYSAAAEPVVWTCNTTTSSYTPSSGSAVSPETCTRTVNGTGSSTFHGIASLTLTGLVGSTLTDTALTSNNYTLQPGQSLSLDWVGISAELVDLQLPGNPTSTVTVSGTAEIPVQTGAALRNYGT